MSGTSQPRDYERSDADPRLLGGIALGLAAFLIAVPFLLLALYPGASRSGGVPDFLPVPPAPRLQTDPKLDLGRLNVQENERLRTFAWADRERQIAHIPIEQAMEILARRGLAGWPVSAPPPNPPQR